MTQDHYQLILLFTGMLVISTLCDLFKRWVRRVMIYRRRHCIPTHAWGVRFGPFRPGPSYHWYWGWKCLRCPATKTQHMSDSEAEAAFRTGWEGSGSTITLNEYRKQFCGKEIV